MELIKAVDKYLENPHLKRQARKRTGWYPSQASCTVTNEYNENVVVGGCLRAMYWQSKGVSRTNPMTARGYRITSIGKKVEEIEVLRYKEMGIWRGNNIKFFNDKYKISGEADAIIYDKVLDGDIGVEIKTGYGYKFQKEVFGSTYRKGKPKIEHLMQVMLYIDYFKLLFKMVYVDRGNAQRGEFDVTLNSDGTPNVDGKKLTNGLSLPGIIHRFDTVAKCLEDGVLPERDYQLKYNKDRLQFLCDSNRLNKKEKEEFLKNKNVDSGDWQCAYCDYKDYCWKENK